MDIQKIKTLGDLKKAKYQVKPVKDELRDNLLNKLTKKEPLFDDIHGYEHTVIPQLQSAILSRHNINLLGLRGQAKTKIARSLVTLLDEYIPVVEGSQIHDDPFAPISRYARDLVKEKGEQTPISWLHRDQRFYEKLATPDVTVADLIGDIDPIKAANLKLSFDNELVLHYGMIPRANRSIFVINELPDLQARIQVALFNILQEGDVQIRGFQLRLPLDIQFVFTANPEDYTNRGSIVTPLKDRIGSQIITHYPKVMEVARKITEQESVISPEVASAIYVPDMARVLIEQIVFEARNSELIDVKSGVSARMSITMYENLMSTAYLRMIKNGDTKTSVRLSDFHGIVPAITGKVELVYEGEQEGAENVAFNLLGTAIKTLFAKHFVEIKKLAKENQYAEFDRLTDWFMTNAGIKLAFDATDTHYQSLLKSIKPLEDILAKYQPEAPKKDQYFLMEFILWAMVEYQRLDRKRMSDKLEFEDSLLGGISSN